MPLSEGVLEYLDARDALTREAVFRRHPALRDAVGTPGLRSELVEWLGTDPPWQPEQAERTARAIDLVRSGEAEDDAPTIKPFLLHPAERVRLRAYEFLLGLYFPDRNPDAVFLLLTGMLSDESEMVRSSGAAYVARVGARDQLRPFLQRWLAMAAARGWQGSESHDLVTRLLAE
jgi:hypothetical protein